MLVLMNAIPMSYASESETDKEVKTLLKAKKYDEIIKMGEPAVESLIKFLDIVPPPVKWNIVKILGEINDPRAIEPLIKVFGSGSSLVNLTAINVLAKMGEPAVEPLIKTLSHELLRVRDSAAMSLGYIKDPKVVKRLIDVLKDDDANVRASAVYALGSIGDTSAVEPLIAMLKDDNETVIKRVALTLKTITKKDHGTDQAKWREWWKENKAK